MNINEFKIGDRVVTIRNGIVERGVISNVYDQLDTAIVEMDDDTFRKVKLSELGIERDLEEKEKTDKVVEKSEITITPDEFRNISARVIAELPSELGIAKLGFIAFTATLHNALFYTEADND